MIRTNVFVSMCDVGSDVYAWATVFYAETRPPVLWTVKENVDAWLFVWTGLDG